VRSVGRPGQFATEPAGFPQAGAARTSASFKKGRSTFNRAPRCLVVTFEEVAPVAWSGWPTLPPRTNLHLCATRHKPMKLTRDHLPHRLAAGLLGRRRRSTVPLPCRTVTALSQRRLGDASALRSRQRSTQRIARHGRSTCSASKGYVRFAGSGSRHSVTLGCYDESSR
jgi:hypothetical protein